CCRRSPQPTLLRSSNLLLESSEFYFFPLPSHLLHFIATRLKQLNHTILADQMRCADHDQCLLALLKKFLYLPQPIAIALVEQNFPNLWIFRHAAEKQFLRGAYIAIAPGAHESVEQLFDLFHFTHRITQHHLLLLGGQMVKEFELRFESFQAAYRFIRRLS